jgi:DNA-binding response OmpR family regulator
MLAELSPPRKSAPANIKAKSDVLVVDGDLDLLEALADALGGEGYAARMALDVDAALDHFAERAPDAVLVAAYEPGIDGGELCRRIKARPEWAHVPVLFMIDLADEAQIERCFASGGVDYLCKPLNLAEVLARLGTQIDIAPARVILPA